MNIHEYQAKAILGAFGAPVVKGVAVVDAGQAEKAVAEIGGPVWVVKAQIHAGGRGKGRFRGSLRRVRGAASGSRARRVRWPRTPARCSAPRWSPSRPGRRAAWCAASTSRRARRSRASFTCPAWSTAASARSPSSPARPVASTSKRWRRKTPDKIVTVHVDPDVGVDAAVSAAVARALGLAGDQADQCAGTVRGALPGVRRQGHEPAGDQPADRHRGGATDLPRRQDHVRRQRALPPPGRRRAARSRRGGPEGGRGGQVRPFLHRPRRHDRLHGQRRRAWRWRRWTSSSSTGRSRRTSSTSAAAPAGRR